VPSFQLIDPVATRQVTVADVLSHRTGLRWHNAFDRDIESNADYYSVSQKLATAPLGCKPGQCYEYQNVAFSLIGDVVFAATGSFYDQAVDRRIFKPLGMNDASIGLAGIENSPSWARPHVRARSGWTSLDPKPTYYRLAPAAGVNASASDMAQWLLAHTGHRPDVLPAPLLATLHSTLINTPGEMRSGWRRERLESAGYALGWRNFDYAGHEVIFHAGAVQGYRGLVALIPERDLGIAIMWNGESSLPSGLLPTVLDAAMGLPPQRWLDVDTDFGSDNLMTEDSTPAPGKRKGVSSDRAVASPR
jgi:beta-lactamase class C